MRLKRLKIQYSSFFLLQIGSIDWLIRFLFLFLHLDLFHCRREMQNASSV